MVSYEGNPSTNYKLKRHKNKTGAAGIAREKLKNDTLREYAREKQHFAIEFILFLYEL